jgi:D-alanyl-lipoteichoic acid acyltransferase DltB (MBOAT superfamily)
VGQLGLLAVFKSCNFFVDCGILLAHRFGIDLAQLHFDIVLPVGISFYTLQTVSYVCDVYFRRQHPVESIVDFALFACYFPPLVAGPSSVPATSCANPG